MIVFAQQVAMIRQKALLLTLFLFVLIYSDVHAQPYYAEKSISRAVGPPSWNSLYGPFPLDTMPAHTAKTIPSLQKHSQILASIQIPQSLPPSGNSWSKGWGLHVSDLVSPAQQYEQKIHRHDIPSAGHERSVRSNRPIEQHRVIHTLPSLRGTEPVPDSSTAPLGAAIPFEARRGPPLIGSAGMLDAAQVSSPAGSWVVPALSRVFINEGSMQGPAGDDRVSSAPAGAYPLRPASELPYVASAAASPVVASLPTALPPIAPGGRGFHPLTLDDEPEEDAEPEAEEPPPEEAPPASQRGVRPAPF